jgi:ArsR family transcriptional regulator
MKQHATAPDARPAVPDLRRLRRAAGEVTGTLRALANEDRLLILCQLSQGEHCVGELEGMLDIHQPTLSQQLGVLRAEGLVATRRDGRQIHYRVADERAVAILNALYGLYCGGRK